MEFENLLTLIKAVSDSELTEFFYEENGTNLRFYKEGYGTGGSHSGTESGSDPSESGWNFVMENEVSGNTGRNKRTVKGNIIKSPLVGTFYAAPAEDADPFVTEGTK